MVRVFSLTYPNVKNKPVAATSVAMLLDIAARMHPRGSLWFHVSEGVEELVTVDSNLDEISLELYWTQSPGEKHIRELNAGIARPGKG